jgi:hypothetical protein
MPGGSEIARQLNRIGRRSRQCAYHNPNFPPASFFWPNTSRTIYDMSSRKMPQASLDAIAGDRIPHRAADDKPDARPFVGMPVEIHNMDDERWPTHAHPPPRRPPKFLRTTHSQRSRQHCGRSRRFRRTAGRGPCAAGPTLWRGRRGSASANGNHGYDCDVDCSAGTCACSRENSQTFGVVTIRVRCSHGTHRRRGEQVAAAAMEATF